MLPICSHMLPFHHIKTYSHKNTERRTRASISVSPEIDSVWIHVLNRSPEPAVNCVCVSRAGIIPNHTSIHTSGSRATAERCFKSKLPTTRTQRRHTTHCCCARPTATSTTISSHGMLVYPANSCEPNHVHIYIYHIHKSVFFLAFAFSELVGG